MTLIDLTVLNLQLNHIIDSDLHHGISLEDARDHIMTGDVFEWLKDTFRDEIDLGIYEKQPSKNEILRQWQRTLARYEGDENRRWGVNHNGICLLVAWTNEIVQQQTAYEADKLEFCDF
jgi:hypothetical protein